MAEFITFFEDDTLKDFYPLTLTRPIYDLRVGIFTLGEKWIKSFDSRLGPSGLHRNYLTSLFPDPPQIGDQESCYWINPRVFPDDNLVQEIRSLPVSSTLKQGSVLIAAHLDSADHSSWIENGVSTKKLDEKIYSESVSSLNKVWEIFQLNGREIEKDIKWFGSAADRSGYPLSTLAGEHPIIIEKGAVIEPGTLFLAKEGPIYIGKGAHIMANSVVRGPAAICDESVVKMGAKIYEATTLGPVCKVGGEVTNVVFHSYSNKAHDGFAGNSVIGQWCNIGADTNTSNLKNNYSTVQIRDWITDEEIETGEQFVGTIMGDHSKTGINSMLNTGTMCGVCCNLFSEGFPPKHIPSFSWVSSNDLVPYRFEKAVEAMEQMMLRRDIQLTAAYREMMREIFSSTQ